MADDTFYCRRGGKTVGPLTMEKLLAGIKNGKIKPTDEVSTDGNNWFPASMLGIPFGNEGGSSSQKKNGNDTTGAVRPQANPGVRRSNNPHAKPNYAETGLLASVAVVVFASVSAFVAMALGNAAFTIAMWFFAGFLLASPFAVYAFLFRHCNDLNLDGSVFDLALGWESKQLKLVGGTAAVVLFLGVLFVAPRTQTFIDRWGGETNLLKFATERHQKFPKDLTEQGLARLPRQKILVVHKGMDPDKGWELSRLNNLLPPELQSSGTTGTQWIVYIECDGKERSRKKVYVLKRGSDEVGRFYADSFKYIVTAYDVGRDKVYFRTEYVGGAPSPRGSPKAEMTDDKQAYSYSYREDPSRDKLFREILPR